MTRCLLHPLHCLRRLWRESRLVDAVEGESPSLSHSGDDRRTLARGSRDKAGLSRNTNAAQPVRQREWIHRPVITEQALKEDVVAACRHIAVLRIRRIWTSGRQLGNYPDGDLGSERWKPPRACDGGLPKALPPRCRQIADSIARKICRYRCPQRVVLAICPVIRQLVRLSKLTPIASPDHDVENLIRMRFVEIEECWLSTC